MNKVSENYFSFINESLLDFSWNYIPRSDYSKEITSNWANEHIQVETNKSIKYLNYYNSCFTILLSIGMHPLIWHDTISQKRCGSPWSWLFKMFSAVLKNFILIPYYFYTVHPNTQSQRTHSVITSWICY